MAIIRHEGALDRLPQTLLSILVQKQQMELAKEEQKLRKADLDMRSQAFEQEMEERNAMQTANQQLLPFMSGGLTQDEVAMAAGAAQDPAVASAIMQQGLQAARQSSEITGIELELDDRRARLEEFNKLSGLRERILEAEALLAEAQPGLSDRDIAVREGQLEVARAQMRQGAAEFARSEVQGLRQTAMSLGMDPNEFLISAYGTSNDAALVSEISAELSGEGAPINERQAQTRHLRRLLSGMGAGPDNIAALEEALFTEGLSPQATVDQFFADENIDEDVKVKIFTAFNRVYEGLKIPEIVQKPFLRSPEFRPAEVGGPASDFVSRLLRANPDQAEEFFRRGIFLSNPR